MKDLIKKIWNWIVSIPQDKLLHDYAAALICMFFFAICYRFCPVWLCFVLADIIAIVALVLKELYDFKHQEEGHSFEIADLFWGCFGILKVNIAFLIMFV